MIGSPLGIDSKWISTNDNKLANEISCIKKRFIKPTTSNPSRHYDFDYTSLKQKYPELKACRFFQPSPKLISMLLEILLTKKSPALKEVVALKQQGLGKLII